MEEVFWIVFVAVSLILMVLYGVLLLIRLIWEWLLAAAVLYGLVWLGLAWWRQSELRREYEHRQRLEAIEHVKHNTIAAMVDEARKASE